MASWAHILKSSFSLKHSDSATQSLNIARDSWQRTGCLSWSGSKYFSQTFLNFPIIGKYFYYFNWVIIIVKIRSITTESLSINYFHTILNYLLSKWRELTILRREDSISGLSCSDPSLFLNCSRSYWSVHTKALIPLYLLGLKVETYLCDLFKFSLH